MHVQSTVSPRWRVSAAKPRSISCQSHSVLNGGDRSSRAARNVHKCRHNSRLQPLQALQLANSLYVHNSPPAPPQPPSLAYLTHLAHLISRPGGQHANAAASTQLQMKSNHLTHPPRLFFFPGQPFVAARAKCKLEKMKQMTQVGGHGT